MESHLDVGLGNPELLLFENVHHIGVRPHCGICGSAFEIAEPVVLLLGNKDSTGFSRSIGPYPFPDFGHYARDATPMFLCRKQGCDRCATSKEEASTVHSDCLAFLSERCGPDSHLDHLWVATAWRSPWRHSPSFHLEETTIKPNVPVLRRLGILGKMAMPPEILQIIYESSASSLVWRYSRVTELARRLPDSSQTRLVSIPLSKISGWTRGSKRVSMEPSRRRPVMRITIDSWGIGEIEKLAEHPRFGRWRSDNLIFVVLDPNGMEGITAHFRFGRLRLELPKNCLGLKNWDTPTPPNVGLCRFYPTHVASSTQYRTIDLGETTGLTFFFRYGKICAVHAHTQEAPNAESTYQCLSRRGQRSVTWVYVPISSRDQISAIGARMCVPEGGFTGSFCLSFRMKLSGDVPVGHSPCSQAKDMVLSKSPPSTIIYNLLEMGTVSAIGTYGSEQEDFAKASFRQPPIDQLPLYNACYSIATLSNVIRIHIFSEKLNGFCRGILLEYENGGQRALGQCRIGVDTSKTYDKPAHLCFRRQAYFRPGNSVLQKLQATYVGSEIGSEHEHRDKGWTCCDMDGELEFWFSPEETMLTLLPKEVAVA